MRFRIITLLPALAFSISYPALAANNVDQPTKTAGPIKSLAVDQKSDARYVITTVPQESAMERFEMKDAQGRNIAYVAMTDGDVGGLVFVDNKLTGAVSKQDALAFYSCRGYASATKYHWAKDANAWIEGLLAASQPTSTITLQFSGKSSWRSIVEVVNNPSLSQIGSLVDIGTNPLGILRKLNNARESMAERELFEKTRLRLMEVTTGTSEGKVAEIIKPEDVSFAVGGLVMAYPRFSIEYFIADGAVKAIQQPSFHVLSHKQAALFYVTNTKWEMCTPENWRNAMPVVNVPAPAVSATPPAQTTEPK
ncbi:hypothetical protein ACO0LL_08815 [Undibacterium sp. TC4M20W]|uniref:hypothetical protein n=1 Tax=unclassified Undibacterium TaxID=2630295 RepID=UPI003BF22FD2